MGLSTSYYTIDGEIIGESSNGVRLDHLTDALGSVTAKVDQTGAVVSTARYKPYGDKLIGTDYMFGWVGIHGYRRAANGQYVRARHYSIADGSWISCDELWPEQLALSYVSANSTNRIDPTGRNWTITRSEVKKGRKWPPTCDNFKINWNYRIYPQEKARGWLVQEVIVDYQATSCDPSQKPEIGCDPVYYEVWFVDQGIPRWPGDQGIGSNWQKPIPPYSDSFSSSNVPCIYGHDNVFGLLTFIPDPEADYRGLNNWLSTHGFTKSNHADCSLALPSTKNGFTKPSNASNWQALGMVTDAFGCCRDVDKSCGDRKSVV